MNTNINQIDAKMRSQGITRYNQEKREHCVDDCNGSMQALFTTRPLVLSIFWLPDG